MPRKILSDRYLLDACKIYKSYPMVPIPHYQASTEGRAAEGLLTRKGAYLVKTAPQQRPQNPVAEAMSALSSNQRPAMVLEVSQQLAESVPEDEWLQGVESPSGSEGGSDAERFRGFMFQGVESDSDSGPDAETMAQIIREAPGTAAYIRAYEAGTPMQMSGFRPAGMPTPTGTTPNPLFRGGSMSEILALNPENLQGVQPGQYVFETLF